MRRRSLLCLPVLFALLVALACPVQARGHHSHPHRYSGYAAGPNDLGGHDYARHIGSSSDPTLSTGWTTGHGSRTHETHDYYRHTKSGRVIHVHGYYHRSHSR